MATNTTLLAPTLDCAIQGNPDLIGLGIRLTFYLQAITTALSAAFLGDHQYDYLQSSGITFFVAVLAVLIREVSNATIRAPEAAVVFWMLYLLAMALGNASSVRTRAYSREAVRQGLLFVTLVYGCWFWYDGIERLPTWSKADEGERACVEYAFYMRKTELRGDYSKMNKVLFPMLSVVYGGWCCFSIYKHVRDSRSSARKTLSDLNSSEPLAPILSDMRDKTKKSHPLVRIIVFMYSTGLILLLSGIWLVVTVPAIEMQIKWNDIRGGQQLDSVGQVAPVMLSIGMLLHVMYNILKGKDEFKEEWEKQKDTREKLSGCPKRKGRVDELELLGRDSRYESARTMS